MLMAVIVPSAGTSLASFNPIVLLAYLHFPAQIAFSAAWPLKVSPSQLPSCPPSKLLCAPPSQNAGLEPSLTLKFDLSHLFLFKLIIETRKHT